MRKVTVLIAILAIFSLSTNVFAQWQTNGNKIYYNNGNVGIGTDNPATELEVYNDEGQYGITSIRLSEGNGVNSIWELRCVDKFEIGDNANGFSIWGGEEGNEDTRISIDQNGNVGINTTIPLEKLEVNGKIKSSGSNSALILVSTDGTEWEVTVDNSGNLSTSQYSKINEAVKNENVKIYPNPAENIIKIELVNNSIQKISIELYDMTGRLVFLKSYSSNIVTVDLTDFDSGNYLLTIKDKDGSILSSDNVVKK